MKNFCRACLIRIKIIPLCCRFIIYTEGEANGNDMMAKPFFRLRILRHELYLAL